jgi:hypothetical protein
MREIVTFSALFEYTIVLISLAALIIRAMKK